MAEQMRIRRLSIEAKNARSSNYTGIKYGPVEDSLENWQASYEGPKESVYAGTTIDVNIQIPKAYPFEPPKMQTDILHPNVYERTGEVCMSILHHGKDKTGYEKIAERWIPGKNIAMCVLGFQNILEEPNFQSAANFPVAVQFRENPELLKNRIMNAFVKKSQNIAFDKCSEVDREKAEKRKRESSQVDQEHGSQDPAEEVQSSKKNQKTGQTQNDLIPLPEQPESGGVLIKFKTSKGDLQRTFDLNNKILSAFHFLSNSGIEAETISISIPGTPRTDIDREKAELSTFENFNIKSSITLYVCEEEED